MGMFIVQGVSNDENLPVAILLPSVASRQHDNTSSPLEMINKRIQIVGIIIMGNGRILSAQQNQFHHNPPPPHSQHQQQYDHGHHEHHDHLHDHHHDNHHDYLMPYQRKDSC